MFWDTNNGITDEFAKSAEIERRPGPRWAPNVGDMGVISNEYDLRRSGGMSAFSTNEKLAGESGVV
jgi:hypothetical protein